MNMNIKTEPEISAHLSKQETETIYRRQQRLYWETDFINRCTDRRQEDTGLCNLPYGTLSEEKELLDLAYEIYTKREDSNTAYNVTLDLVIDEIEQQIKNNTINRKAEMKQEVAE